MDQRQRYAPESRQLTVLPMSTSALARRIRPVAVVATLQLLFYVYVYFTAPVETRYYVLTSFSRLVGLAM